MAQIEIRNLSIQYKRPNTDESFTAIERVTVAVSRGEFVTIVGSSGCGKSTLLLAIAGLLPSTRGSIELSRGYIHVLDRSGLARLAHAGEGR